MTVLVDKCLFSPHDLVAFLPKANADILGLALKRCFDYRSTDLPQSFSAVLNAIDTDSLERGWESATASVPNKPQFKTTFETIVKLIGEMEMAFYI